MSSILRDFSDAASAVVENVARGVVAINGRDWGGSSGVIIKAGVIVTAEEALERDDEVEVILPNGNDAKASVVGRDPSTAVAVLRVNGADGTEPTAAALPRAGALVISVGRVGKNVVSALGSIAYVGEAWRSTQGGLIDARIRADVSLRRATEGGALADAEGNVVGMAVFGPLRRVLAIPYTTVIRAVEHILVHGSVTRGYAGFSVQPVPLDGASGRGAIVIGLDPEGPAKKAGILLGDIVLTWDGDIVGGTRAIIDRLGPATVGKEVRVGLSRAGNPIDVTLRVVARPSI